MGKVDVAAIRMCCDVDSDVDPDPHDVMALCDRVEELERALSDTQALLARGMQFVEEDGKRLKRLERVEAAARRYVTAELAAHGTIEERDAFDQLRRLLAEGPRRAGEGP